MREAHGDLTNHALVEASASLKAQFPHRFMHALVQWEYQTPTIQVTPYDDRGEGRDTPE